MQVLNQLLLGISYMAVWVQLPYSAEYSSEECDIWTWWNSLRSLCRYHPLLGTCLELGHNLPSQPFRCAGSYQWHHLVVVVPPPNHDCPPPVADAWSSAQPGCMRHRGSQRRAMYHWPAL